MGCNNDVTFGDKNIVEISSDVSSETSGWDSALSITRIAQGLKSFSELKRLNTSKN